MMDATNDDLKRLFNSASDEDIKTFNLHLAAITMITQHAHWGDALDYAARQIEDNTQVEKLEAEADHQRALRDSYRRARASLPPSPIMAALGSSTYEIERLARRLDEQAALEAHITKYGREGAG